MAEKVDPTFRYRILERIFNPGKYISEPKGQCYNVISEVARRPTGCTVEEEVNKPTEINGEQSVGMHRNPQEQLVNINNHKRSMREGLAAVNAIQAEVSIAVASEITTFLVKLSYRHLDCAHHQNPHFGLSRKRKSVDVTSSASSDIFAQWRS